MHVFQLTRQRHQEVVAEVLQHGSKTCSDAHPEVLLKQRLEALNNLVRNLNRVIHATAAVQRCQELLQLWGRSNRVVRVSGLSKLSQCVNQTILEQEVDVLNQRFCIGQTVFGQVLFQGAQEVVRKWVGEFKDGYRGSAINRVMNLARRLRETLTHQRCPLGRLHAISGRNSRVQ